MPWIPSWHVTESIIEPCSNISWTSLRIASDVADPDAIAIQHNMLVIGLPTFLRAIIGSGALTGIDFNLTLTSGMGRPKTR